MNRFKHRLQARELQIGLWLSLASAYTAEICAGAGFDWLAIDAEHGPNDVRSVLAQLQAVAAYPVDAVVRPPTGADWMIKQLLDIGARTLLIPMVDTAEQARHLVSATRYPPAGHRGVGAAVARASGFDRNPTYMAETEICLLIQIESAKALQNLPEILAVPGIDGFFIGPADLSASLGHPNDPTHPDAQAAIDAAIDAILAAGHPAGTLYGDDALARRVIARGATFVAVGTDVALLARGADALASRFDRAIPITESTVY